MDVARIVLTTVDELLDTQYLTTWELEVFTDASTVIVIGSN